MSWGNKILIVFIAFGSMISYMVYRCVKTPVNLVSEQYYKDELAYQTVIDGTRRANSLSGKLQLIRSGDRIRIQLPVEMTGKIIVGWIFFYCPSNIAQDRKVSLSTDEAGRQEIGPGVVPMGHYSVKVSWESAGLNYFIERPIIIQ